jgi:sugar phosphate isomerase/epimerase
MLLNDNQIALNLESVQDKLTNNGEIVKSLKRIRHVGYQAVEILHFINPENGVSWRTLLDDAGLKCCATHELYEDIEANPDAMIKKANDLGCKYIAAGLAKKTVWENADSVKTLVKSLNKTGEICKKAGISLLYHNHNMEFVKMNHNTACLDYIFNETNPEYVGSELDVYWVQLSGANPITWCKKLKGRLRALHLKDLGVTGGTPEKYIKTPVCKELGGGNMEFYPIVQAAKDSNCEWFIIETHTNWVDNDSLKTADLSFKYIKSRIC